MTGAESAFLEFVHAITGASVDEVAVRLLADPSLARHALHTGATRQESREFFLPEIAHYLYAGDTALHVAAAAHLPPVSKLLISNGAAVRARNRRGAEPIHYAADGDRLRPHEQAEVIALLVQAGADPNAVDRSGVAPLHRAVRARSAAAVEALLACGANVQQRNASGSSPLHLAVQNTGAGGSGSEQARAQQALIIRMLLADGASPSDRDAKGKTVAEAARGKHVREPLLSAGAPDTRINLR